MYRSIALAAAFVLTASAAQAGPVTFNDGTTFSNDWSGFDPFSGNVLNVGVSTAAQNWVAHGGAPGFNYDFTAFGQSRVTAYNTFSSGGFPLPGNYTVVFGLTETITNVTGTVGGLGSTAQFVVNPSGSVNYFQFFKMGAPGDDLAGTGFNGTQAQLVLAGHFTNQIAGTPGQIGINGAPNPPVPLDGNGTNQYGNPTWNGMPGPVNTLGATGDTGLEGVIDYFDPTIFTVAPGFSLIGSTLQFTT